MSREQIAARIDAVNHILAEMELAYPGQFRSVFIDEQKLTMAKQLWFDELKHFTPEQILLGSRRAIRQSKYLPSLHDMINHCTPRLEDFGLPEAHQAYLEACRAPSPKSAQAWSHPAVYHAGRQTDWFLLAGSPEREVFPLFKRNYEILCERVIRGESLEEPIAPALPEHSSVPLPKEEQRARLQQLRDALDL